MEVVYFIDKGRNKDILSNFEKHLCHQINLLLQFT